jgi:hypothetical protein
MNRRWLLALLVTLMLFDAGCGYFKAGTWEDDPGNWKRAFHSTKPEDVTVVHSKYWRSPHWTYEFQYFFEIAPNPKLKEQLFSKNKLRLITGNQAAKAKGNFFGDAPSWFAPRSVTDYDIWVFDQEPLSNFKVLIDRDTGNMFVTDYQV